MGTKYRKGKRVVWTKKLGFLINIIPPKDLHGVIDSQTKYKNLDHPSVWVRFDEEVVPGITLYMVKTAALEFEDESNKTGRG